MLITMTRIRAEVVFFGQALVGLGAFRQIGTVGHAQHLIRILCHTASLIFLDCFYYTTDF